MLVKPKNIDNIDIYVGIIHVKSNLECKGDMVVGCHANRTVQHEPCAG